MDHNTQQKIDVYFAQHWPHKTKHNYRYTGPTLAHQIAPGEHVIDVGCGLNQFRSVIPNLIGVDPAFDQADHKMTIQQFAAWWQGHQFDVALCLGSINFGTVDDILGNIRSVRAVMRPLHRIYWRCNPGRHDHGLAEFEQVPVFPWSWEWHHKLSDQLGYRLAQLEWDNHDRIFAEWITVS